MIFKLISSNFYPALLDKLFMNFIRARKEVIKTEHGGTNRSIGFVDQMLLQDAVWHRSKSARYQQN